MLWESLSANGLKTKCGFIQTKKKEMKLLKTLILILAPIIGFSQQQPEIKPLPDLTQEVNVQAEIVCGVREVQRIVPTVASDTTGVGITEETKFFLKQEIFLDTVCVPRFFYFDRKSGAKIYIK